MLMTNFLKKCLMSISDQHLKLILSLSSNIMKQEMTLSVKLNRRSKIALPPNNNVKRQERLLAVLRSSPNFVKELMRNSFRKVKLRKVLSSKILWTSMVTVVRTPMSPPFWEVSWVN